LKTNHSLLKQHGLLGKDRKHAEILTLRSYNRWQTVSAKTANMLNYWRWETTGGRS